PLDRGRDEARDVLFASNVGHDRCGANRGGGSLAGLLVQVGQHDVGAVVREPRAQTESDAARAASDDADLLLDVHDDSSAPNGTEASEACGVNCTTLKPLSKLKSASS